MSLRTEDGPRLSAAQERRVRAYVQENLSRRITLDELAGCVALSRYHFLRTFRRTTHLTPHAFVTQERLDRARELLDGSDLSLGQIASTCGFSDQSHMNRVFRRRLAQTPGEYRARTLTR